MVYLSEYGAIYNLTAYGAESQESIAFSGGFLPLRTEKLYAAKFVNMINDQEFLIRAALYKVQLDAAYAEKKAGSRAAANNLRQEAGKTSEGVYCYV